MSISMTWANYALMVSVCLVIYYLIIALLFYRKGFLSSAIQQEIKPTFEPYHSSDNHSSDKKSNFNLFGEEIGDEELQFRGEENEFTTDAQNFADEVQAYTSSCDNNIEKEELLLNLREIIHKYPSLLDSESKYELSQLIAISSENYCSVHFTADEVSALWNE